jgi:predicted anti-sigma-YlaC factor YlaD
MLLKPTCKEIHRLASESLDRPLSLVERARVQVHLMVCDACRNFSGQMQLIRRAMRGLGSGEDSDSKGGQQ